MPWNCGCGVEVAHDDQKCPECGKTKAEWTVDFNVTRDFVVRKRSSVAFELVDREDGEVTEERFTVRFPDESEQAGETNEMGWARVRSPGPGACVVRFPDRYPGEVTLVPEEDGEGEQAPPEQAEGSEAEQVEVAQVTLTAGQKRRKLRVQSVGVLALTLLDELGEGPLAEAPYAVLDDGGELLHEGTTDAEGRLDHGHVLLGYYELLVDEVSCPVPAVLPGDEHLPVRVHGVPPQAELEPQVEEPPHPPDEDPEHEWPETDWLEDDPTAVGAEEEAE